MVAITRFEIPSDKQVRTLNDIPPDTLDALRVIEPCLYGGPLKTVGRAACLLRSMQDDEGYIARTANASEAVGAAVVESADERAWLKSLAVNPQYRNEGAGSELLQHIITEAVSRHLRRVELMAIGDRAIGFYEKHGFAPVAGQAENSVMLRMGKDIA